MKNHPVKKFILVRSDGILLARYRDKDWYLTTDSSRACRLPEADSQAVLQSIIPESERFLWTLHPIVFHWKGIAFVYLREAILYYALLLGALVTTK